MLRRCTRVTRSSDAAVAGLAGHHAIWRPHRLDLLLLIIFCLVQGLGASGVLILLISGELDPVNVVGFCIAASNAFGLIAGVHMPCCLPVNTALRWSQPKGIPCPGC